MINNTRSPRSLSIPQAGKANTGFASEEATVGLVCIALNNARGPIPRPDGGRKAALAFKIKFAEDPRLAMSHAYTQFSGCSP